MAVQVIIGSVVSVVPALALLLALLAHEPRHLLRLLLLLQFLVVFLARSFARLANPLLFLELLLAFLLLHVLDRVESLDQRGNFPFLLALQQLGNLQAFSASHSCLFALTHLLHRLERQLCLQLVRHCKGHECLGGSVDGLVL